LAASWEARRRSSQFRRPAAACAGIFEQQEQVQRVRRGRLEVEPGIEGGCLLVRRMGQQHPHPDLVRDSQARASPLYPLLPLVMQRYGHK
jgi:hypothetical protein